MQGPPSRPATPPAEQAAPAAKARALRIINARVGNGSALQSMLPHTGVPAAMLLLSGAALLVAGLFCSLAGRVRTDLSD